MSVFYGLPYCGSKQKFAKRIADAMPAPKGRFVELFAGGAALSDLIGERHRCPILLNDVLPIPRNFVAFKAMGNFCQAPEFCSRERFFDLREQNDASSWPRLGIASNVNAHAIGIDFDTLGRLTKKGDALFNAYGSPYEGDVISLGGKYFEPFTVEQIDSIRILLPTLLAHYAIDRRDIVGHCDVSPGRKTDPEAIFPWAIGLSCLDGDPVTRRELAELVRYH